MRSFLPRIPEDRVLRIILAIMISLSVLLIILVTNFFDDYHKDYKYKYSSTPEAPFVDSFLINNRAYC